MPVHLACTEFIRRRFRDQIQVLLVYRGRIGPTYGLRTRSVAEIISWINPALRTAWAKADDPIACHRCVRPHFPACNSTPGPSTSDPTPPKKSSSARSWHGVL